MSNDDKLVPTFTDVDAMNAYFQRRFAEIAAARGKQVSELFAPARGLTLRKLDDFSAIAVVVVEDEPVMVR